MRERETERERKKTQVADTIKIYGPRRMRRLGMEETKKGRRKNAK